MDKAQIESLLLAIAAANKHPEPAAWTAEVLATMDASAAIATAAAPAAAVD